MHFMRKMTNNNFLIDTRCVQIDVNHIKPNSVSIFTQPINGDGDRNIISKHVSC